MSTPRSMPARALRPLHPGPPPTFHRALGCLLLSGLLVTMPIGTAHAEAAPARTPEPDPADPPDPDEDSEPAPTLEEARLMVGRDLYAHGNDRFAAQDYPGAIAAWKQVLLLMPEQEAALRAPLAHAHRSAYGIDADPSHLQAARELFTDQLESLSPEDPARKDLEAEIDGIDAELLAIEEAKAKAQAEREEAIRQEQAQLRQQALAEAEAEHQRKIQKVYYGVGGSLGGLGVGTLAAMTAFLSLGAKADREGQRLVGMTGVTEGRYRDLLADGESYNRTAAVTGVLGGVLVLSGAALLVVAASRHRRGKEPRDEAVAITPALGGVALRF